MFKRRITASVLWIFVSIIITSNTGESQQNNPLKDRFSVGVYNWLLRPVCQNPEHTSWYSDLNLNINHSYTNRADHDLGGDIGVFGGFYDSLNDYRANVLNTISNNSQTGNKKYLERAKIIRPAFGQRSTYQAELPPNGENTFPVYYYEHHNVGSPFNERGGTVYGWKCESGNPGYMVKTLRENCEQVDYIITDPNKTGTDYFASDVKEAGWKWYIKPRMRIPVSVTNDPNRQNEIVVTLEICNFWGEDSLISKYIIPITVSNFSNYPGGYNGDYIEIYYDRYSNPIDIIAPASYLTSGIIPPYDVETSQVDYRVWWNGTVPVYLDYVRVDDEWAHFLFEPNYPGNPYDFHTKIQEEVFYFSGQTGFGYFYKDEGQFNSFPCMAYVNRLIKDYDQLYGHQFQTGLFGLLNKDVAIGWLGHLKKQPSNEQYLQYLLSVNDLLTDISLYENYPFTNSNKYPSNLPDWHTFNLPPHINYNRASSPSDYNNNLMYTCLEDRGSMNMYRLNGATLKQIQENQKNIIFSSCIQIHSWETAIGATQNPDYYNQREPTNEEINLEAFLSLIYGAKQVLYFCYNTGEDLSGIYHDYGLLNNNTTRRLQNYYGQNKWEAVKQLTSKLRAIGDYMYP